MAFAVCKGVQCRLYGDVESAAPFATTALDVCSFSLITAKSYLIKASQILRGHVCNYDLAYFWHWIGSAACVGCCRASPRPRM